MFIVLLLRWIRGYIKIKITGDYTSLLNACYKNNISMWGVYKFENNFYGYIHSSDYIKLKRSLKNKNVHIKGISKNGMYFLFKRHKKRWGLIIGAFLFISVIMLMQSFIWSINISGNVNIPTEQLTDILNKNGVKSGAFIPSVDFEKAREMIRLKIDNISWLSINRMGSKIYLEIQEAEKKPEIIPNDVPCDIVAAKDGIIVSKKVYDGQSEIVIGEAVTKGDILVNGIMEDKKGNSVFKHASADIYADTINSVDFKIKYNSQNTAPKKVMSFFHPFDSENKSNSDFSYSKIISFFGIELPIGISYDIFTQNNYKINANNAKKVLEQQYKIYCLLELNDAQIKSKKDNFILSENKAENKTEIECIENIAVSKKILLESIEKN